MASKSHLVRSSLMQIMNKFGRILNSTVRVDQGTMTSSITLPGLAYKDFTRAATPAIWEVLRLVEVNRIFQAKDPKYDLLPAEGRNKYEVGVVSAQTVHLTEAFYKKASLDLPMVFTTRPGRLGKRSCTLMSTLIEKSTGITLADVERQYAFMDLKTRQVVDMPDNLHGLLKEHNVEGLPPFKIAIPAKPESVYTYSCKVRHSDSDLAYHANQSVYVKYCMDCAATAQVDGFLPHLHEDIMALQVNKVEVLYKAESFMNDMLNVVMWTDVNAPLKLHFQIYKDNAMIVFSTISFYGLNTSAKL